MKLIIILLVLALIFALFSWGGNAYVEISQPFEGEEFWDYGGEVSVPFEIKVLYQLQIFSPDVDDRYYFWPSPYPFYDPTGAHRSCQGKPRPHYGVDIAFDKLGVIKEAKPIVSAYCGYITDAQFRPRGQGDYGYLVMVYYPAIDKTILYAHLLTPWVIRGQQIEPGSLIATVGHTGNADPNNPHVHIETYEGYATYWNRKHRINPMPTLYNGHLDNLAFNLTCRGILQNRRTWDLTGHNFWSESRQAPDTFIARFNWSSSSPLEGIHLADAKAWGKTEPTCSGFPPQQPEMEGQDQREFIIRKPRLYLYQTRGDVDVNLFSLL